MRSSTWTSTSSGRGLRRGATPAPRRSMAWTVTSPGRGEPVASRSSCCAALESVPWSRSDAASGPTRSTRQPISSPPGPREDRPAGPPSTSARTASRRSLPPDGPRQGVEPDDRRRDLEPGERSRGMRGGRVVAGVGGSGPEHDRRDRHVTRAPRRGAPTTAASAIAAALEDGLDLGRRDVLAASHDPVRAPVDDESRPVVVEAPEVAGPDRAGGGGLAHVAGEPRHADAVGEPAVDLALDDHRVDAHAAVVDRDEAADLDHRGARVDVDDADVGAERERQVRRVVDGLGVEPRLDARRAARSSRAPPSRSPGSSRPARGSPLTAQRAGGPRPLEVLGRDLEHRRGDDPRPLADLARGERRRRAAHRRRARPVGAEAVGRRVRVAVDDLDVLRRDARAPAATICANVVSWPWPWVCTLIASCAVPVGDMRSAAPSFMPRPRCPCACAARRRRPR